MTSCSNFEELTGGGENRCIVQSNVEDTYSILGHTLALVVQDVKEPQLAFDGDTVSSPSISSHGRLYKSDSGRIRSTSRASFTS
jgi:hypothetical protein